MVLSVSVHAQLRRDEHIGLIFVQCWEKTSLQSLGHRGCHCRMVWPARRRSHPSPTHVHLQRQSTEAPSEKWAPVGVHIFAYLSYKYALHIQGFFLCIFSDMNLNIQAKERVLRVCIFCVLLAHIVLTKINTFSAGCTCMLHR